MADIFISYSREDRKFVQELYRELRRFNVRGFMDATDIAAGADLSRQMREAVENADAIVVVLSRAALKSSWVMAELGMAESLGKQIIPVLAPGESFDDSVPPHLVDRLVVDSGKCRIEETAARIAAAATNIPVDEALYRTRSMTHRRWFMYVVVTSLTMLMTLMTMYTSIWSTVQRLPNSERENGTHVVEVLTFEYLGTNKLNGGEIALYITCSDRTKRWPRESGFSDNVDRQRIVVNQEVAVYSPNNDTLPLNVLCVGIGIDGVESPIGFAHDVVDVTEHSDERVNEISAMNDGRKLFTVRYTVKKRRSQIIGIGVGKP